VKVWTAHVKKARSPVLVEEGWSWGAALFGPLWLLAHRAWIAGAAYLVLVVGLAAALPAGLQGVAALGLGVLSGLLGRDVLRWTLARRGYVLDHVVAAQDEEAALSRLLDTRGDLAAAYNWRLW
jgi:hypothetical protein